jgi:hypothetical protein
MAISYKLNDQLLIIKTEGDFQPEDLQVIFSKVFSDPNFKLGIKILVHDL